MFSTAELSLHVFNMGHIPFKVPYFATPKSSHYVITSARECQCSSILCY